MAAMPDRRLHAILSALVRHLHAFAREVRLTEAEWEAGVECLNRIGRTTDDRHNEGVLMSDVLGLSTLVCLLNNGDAGATETAAALLGPFWRDGAPRVANGGSLLRSPTPGPALFVRGRVTGPDGAPIGEARVDVWQSSPVGLYENQDPDQADMNLRGILTTDADGRFAFRSVRPAGYPVPTHGPAGDVLRAQGRHPYRPAHLHVLCAKPGWKTLVSQVFDPHDPYLASDAVFGVTAALIGDFVEHGPGEAPPEPDIAAPWYSLDHTFVMEPGESRLPRPPIA
ncbi:dioxygenase [Methylobacterium sp. NEAU 140]|nr:dioxygenase [Methylobacterium sp. NEAU 140]MDP4022582.1 dioxygenase [Methylobacterium sp. NEAU 140]